VNSGSDNKYQTRKEGLAENANGGWSEGKAFPYNLKLFISTWQTYR